MQNLNKKSNNFSFWLPNKITFSLYNKKFIYFNSKMIYKMKVITLSNNNNVKFNFKMIKARLFLIKMNLNIWNLNILMKILVNISNKIKIKKGKYIVNS